MLTPLNPAESQSSIPARYPRRAISWRLRTRSLRFCQQPLLMGIINVTPDSFSDGGRFHDIALAIQQGL